MRRLLEERIVLEGDALPKSAACIRGPCLFEAWRLLEEIRQAKHF